MPERKYEIPAGDEIDYAAEFDAWLEKGATGTQVLFGDWIAEKADLATYFKTAKEVDAAKLGVQLALKWRMHFQRSAENHESKDSAREARAQEAAAKPKRAPKASAEDEAPARPARRGRPAKEVTEDAAPARPARRGGRAAAAAKPGATAEAKPARRPAATGAKGRPARRGAATPEADF